MAPVAESVVLQNLSWGESDRIAWEIVFHIREGVMSLGRSSRSLERIASFFNVVLRWDRGGDEPGGYLPPLSEGSTGLIVLSPRLSSRRRWRAFIHELAHHLMHDWVAGACYSARRVLLAGSPDCAPLRHAIARRVEQLLSDL